MTKKHHQNDNQLSLLDAIQSAELMRNGFTDEGSCNIHAKFCHTLTNAIKASGLSRWEIAGRMSHLLDVEVTKFMLDSWTSESKEGNRMPAEYLGAFCRATQCNEAVMIITDLIGVYCLPGEDALRSEIQKLDDQRRDIGKQITTRKAYLKGLQR